MFRLTYPAPPEIYTLSLHDALPIWVRRRTARSTIVRAVYPRRSRRSSSASRRTAGRLARSAFPAPTCLPFGGTRCSSVWIRSEEHTSELQSHHELVCRLLLEKKNKRSVGSEAFPDHQSRQIGNHENEHDAGQVFYRLP